MSEQNRTEEQQAVYETTQATSQEIEGTYSGDLYSEVTMAIEPLKAYFEALQGSNEDIALVGRTLCDCATGRIEEMFTLLHKNVGWPMVNVACQHNPMRAKEGAVISCYLKGSKAVKA